MPENYFVQVRRQKKIELLEFLKGCSTMELEKALAIFSHKTGLSLSKVKLYYEELDKAGLFEGL